MKEQHQMQQVDALEKEIKFLRSDLEREASEVDELSGLVDELQAENKALHEANSKLTAQLAARTTNAVAPAIVPREVDDGELAILRTENEELRREVEGLNRTLERGTNVVDIEALRRQNAALTEELRIFRNQLVYSEQKIRELEREVSRDQEEPTAQ